MNGETNQRRGRDETDDASLPKPPSVETPLDAEPEATEKDGRQFTLGEWLAAVTCCTVLMSVLSCLPGGCSLENFAGIAGVAALTGLVLASVFGPSRPLVRLSWWAMVGAYAVACAWTVVRHLH